MRVFALRFFVSYLENVNRVRERILAAWDSALLSRNDLPEIIDKLSRGDLTAQEWVKENLRWSDE